MTNKDTRVQSPVFISRLVGFRADLYDSNILHELIYNSLILVTIQFGKCTEHVFNGLVRQLTRGIPSLVPVPTKRISDCDTGD